MTIALDEIVVEFVLESREGLDRIEGDLLALEANPTEREALDSVFRAIHSLKGTAGLLGFHRMEAVAHAAETYLSGVREGELRLDAAATTQLLETLDTLRGQVDFVESNGTEQPGSDPGLVSRLHDLVSGGAVRPVPTLVSEAPEPSMPPGNEELEWLGPPPGWSGLTGADTLEAATEPLARPVVAPPPLSPPDSAPDARRERKADTHVRVDVRVLDELMNLVGELVLVRNRMVQESGRSQDARETHATQQLDLITTELQEGVMKARMQTVGTVLSRVPRQVRDLCKGLDKDVRVEIEGEDTELDRTVIEAIKDPLTHLVRNAVDHGIEPTQTRTQAGKPPQGTLRLQASHQGGQVHIVISDDGGGIAVDRVCERALERGVVTQAELARMTDQEVLELIFRPGFSTAAAVTNLSGRGVGMDVVRNHVEQIGGTVEVHSELGEGTTFRLRIPLTLAIIPTLLVTCAGSRYALPQVSLVELVRVSPAARQEELRDLHGAKVLRLRGTLLPLVDLGDLLGTGSSRPEDVATPVAVLQAGRLRFGLIIDEINDTEELVVKPMGRLLKGLSPYAGATILGDGSVALILDVPELARSAALQERKDAAEEEPTAAASRGEGTPMQLLTFALGEGRMAVPLGQVARLEEIEAQRVEHAAGRPVLQYRDDLLPLILLGEELGLGTPPSDRPLAVLVCRVEGGSVGVVVDEILDIVEEEVRVLRTNPRAHPAVSRTAVVEGKVTDLLDMEALVGASAPPFLATA